MTQLWCCTEKCLSGAEHLYSWVHNKWRQMGTSTALNMEQETTTMLWRACQRKLHIGENILGFPEMSIPISAEVLVLEVNKPLILSFLDENYPLPNKKAYSLEAFSVS